MNLRKKRDNTGSWKRKHYITLYGELAFEEAMDLSQDRLRDDDDDDNDDDNDDDDDVTASCVLKSCWPILKEVIAHEDGGNLLRHCRQLVLELPAGVVIIDPTRGFSVLPYVMCDVRTVMAACALCFIIPHCYVLNSTPSVLNQHLSLALVLLLTHRLQNLYSRLLPGSSRDSGNLVAGLQVPGLLLDPTTLRIGYVRTIGQWASEACSSASTSTFLCYCDSIYVQDLYFFIIYLLLTRDKLGNWEHH
jgi:hypothetical protein